MKVAYLCDRGLEREENEDSILVDAEANLFVVADGMGGHEKGSIASSMVIDAFRAMASFLENEALKHLEESEIKKTLEKALNTQVETVSKDLMLYAKENSIDEVMGTTIVGLYELPMFNKDLMQKWAIFHLGDSRLYHVGATTLTQLTLDHSGSSTDACVISKAIGNFPAMALSVNYISVKEGDLFLLCSDGVSDYCNNVELLDLVLKYRYSLPLLCQYVKALVYERGAKDNLSLIAVEVVGA